MVYVDITREAQNAIRGKARPGLFSDNGRTLANGMIQISLEEETLARLVGIALVGESLSDTIIRLCSGRPN